MYSEHRFQEEKYTAHDIRTYNIVVPFAKYFSVTKNALLRPNITFEKIGGLAVKGAECSRFFIFDLLRPRRILFIGRRLSCFKLLKLWHP